MLSPCPGFDCDQFTKCAAMGILFTLYDFKESSQHTRPFRHKTWRMYTEEPSPGTLAIESLAFRMSI